MNINKFLKKHISQTKIKFNVNESNKIQFIEYSLTENEINFYQFISYYSNYLKKIINNDFSFFVFCLRKDIESIYSRLCDLISTLDLHNYEFEEYKREIRLLKKKVNIFLSLKSVLNDKNIEKIGILSSKLADQLIQTSLKFSVFQYSKDNCDLLTKKIEIEKSGFFLIAIGKLGSNDLNFSSDVDLLFFFDEERIQQYINKNPGHHLNLIIKKFIDILSDINEFDFVYRVDFRLRPDPGLTPIAISITAAENYYFGLGQNWERAALIRSRYVCGDHKSFKVFFKILKKFIWRPTLDFYAIDDIKSIKNQIEVNQQTTFYPLYGYNIKIGKGGIREIEFYVHILQLIWGGKYKNLQSNNLIQSINSLCIDEIINSKLKDLLINNYLKLRNLENRIQMLDNNQIHLLPLNKEIYEKLIIFCGYCNIKKFEYEITEILKSTRIIFKELFKEDKPLNIGGDMVFTGVEPEEKTILSLKKLNFINAHQVWKLISSWHYGRYRIMQSEKSRQLLTILIPELLEKIGQTPNPNETLYRFDNFLKNLSYGIHVLSLLKENKNVLLIFLSILGLSPKLGQYMSTNVNLVESLLDKNFLNLELLENYIQQELTSIKELEESYEEKVKKFSSIINEIKFQIGVNYLLEKADSVKCQELLSNLAIISLKETIEIVFKEYQFQQTDLSNCEFGVIGFGNISKKSLNFESDLDLVYIFNFKDKKKYNPNKIGLLFDNFVKRLELFLSYKSINSSVYEIDTRLRPYGASGSRVVNIDSLSNYYSNKAWSWEKLALAGSKLIVGSDYQRKKLDHIKNQCLKNINLSILIKEINKMRNKLIINNTPNNFLDLKHKKGGPRDIAFVNQLLSLLDINKINKSIDKKNFFKEIYEINFLSSILFDVKSLNNLKIDQFANIFLQRIGSNKNLRNEIVYFLSCNDLIYSHLFSELEI